jgi:NADH-quinone oxidoreductase subunit L
MEKILMFAILIPFISFFFVQFINKKNEKWIFYVSTGMMVIHFVLSIIYTLLWVYSSNSKIFYESPLHYERGNTIFAVDLLFDFSTMVYSLLTSFIGSMIMLFSRFYMHRDPGFKRFYSTLLLFLLGLNLIIFSGNFEVLFVGWEIIGISSFLLIGFYRERYLPVKNAFKVVSLFRLSDVLLLIAVWMCHHTFGRTINFNELSQVEFLSLLNQSALFSVLIPVVFLVVAMIKSAQFPFSFWLPRAMEGPTTSSAIFYGSLSVHIGVFLLIRLSPFWIDSISIRVAMGLIGLITAIVAILITSVQSTVKTQIGYASIAQIGLIFIELSLGLEKVAMIHVAGNALLRSYQLLVSPSVLHYLIHNQLYHFTQPNDNLENWKYKKLKSTLMILSIKEWNMDSFHYRIFWFPFKTIGNKLKWLNQPVYIFLAIFILFIGILSVYFKTDLFFLNSHYFGYVLMLIAFLLIMNAFTERDSSKRAWLLLLLSQLFILVAIAHNEKITLSEILLYLSGILVSGLIGYLSLVRIIKLEGDANLQGHYGHVYEHPKLATVFFLSCLGVAGFPLTPSFIGIDVVLSHLDHHPLFLIVFLGLNYIFIDLAALRIFSRIYLGPHKKAYHEIAFKSA